MDIFFTNDNFNAYCDILAKKDASLKRIIKTIGYPSIYFRTPCFESLIHIILEQQVSLASAKAAFVRLKQKIGTVNPTQVIKLSDEDLKECYFSRQKIVYARALATAIINNEININAFTHKTNEEVRSELIKIKGIGNWTIDVFLMMCLQRINLFPIGDIALINSMKYELELPSTTTKEELLIRATKWQPYQTIAAFILWHAYIKRKGIVLQ
jgi:DNA-3-methyladenine glycosylase II